MSIQNGEKTTAQADKIMKIERRVLSNDQTPFEVLVEIAKHWKLNMNEREFASKLDEFNMWPSYRDKFEYPKLRKLPKGKFNGK